MKDGLYKTIKFKKPSYVGDPINAIKIFNEKEVDELILLDIEATGRASGPNYQLITEVASECFMPLGYGGGVNSIEHIQRILALGVEKVVIRSEAARNPKFIETVTQRYGSSTIVVSIDYKKDFFGRNRVFDGKKLTAYTPEQFALLMEQSGAGEIIVQCMDRDGTFQGYDLETIQNVVKTVTVPVVCLGGAGNFADLKGAIQRGVSGASAGSMFVYQKPHRAVLISYPTQEELDRVI
jgi:cyclase